MATFGNTGAAADSYASLEDKIIGCEFICSESGTADSISVTIKNTSGGACKVKCLIYRASDNVLVGVTNERDENFNSWESEYTFTFASSPALTAQNYILGAWADAAVNLGYSFNGGYSLVSDAETYNGAPDPFADDAESASKIATIYCNYIPTGGAMGASSSIAPLVSALMRADVL